MFQKLSYKEAKEEPQNQKEVHVKHKTCNGAKTNILH